MAYYLTFFCRSGEENGSSALARFLSQLTEMGDPVLIKRATADYADEVDVCELATDNGSGMPAAGWLIVQLSAGVELLAAYLSAHRTMINGSALWRMRAASSAPASLVLAPSAATIRAMQPGC